MAITNLYLDMRGRANDGKGSILITIYHNRTTSTIPMKIRVSPENWDGNHIVRMREADILNAHLAGKKASIDMAIAGLSLREDFGNMTATQIKNLITDKRSVDSSRSMVKSLFEEYMASDLSDGTREIYKSTLGKVLSFGGQSMRIDQIDANWLIRFDRYLAKTQGVNGRAIYLRSLRAVCNYARKIKVMSTYPFDDFKIRQEQTRHRNISVDDLRRFLGYKVTPEQEMARDFFMLMFYLVGCNVVDLLTAKRTNIVNGRFEYIRRKTHKAYSIKIEPEAERLIDKYHGVDWLLSPMDHYARYKSFARMVNRNIKEIGDVSWEMVPVEDDLFAIPKLEKRIIPVIPEVTTYYARHTWSTLAYDIGIPIDVVSQALGHSDGNRTTLIYVKRDQKKVDDANRQVIDYLLGLDKPALLVP